MESNWSIFWSALSALGTVGAVILALHFARRDQVREEKAAALRASLGAASMTYRLQNTQSALQSCIARITFGETNVDDHASVLLALAEVKRVVTEPLFEPSADELVALVPLGNSCAHRIARAIDYIGAVRGTAESINPDTLTTHEASRLLDQWLTIFGAAAGLLAAALVVCSKAGERDAPDLTNEERYGPEFADSK